MVIADSSGHISTGEEGEEGEPPGCVEFDANLTWPNHHLSKDDQLALLYKVNNFDYSTRGRAFTVSGPSEASAERKYRNIINYFETSLDDMGSLEWSRNSLQRRAPPSVRASSGDIRSDHGSATHLVRATPGPKPHNLGDRTSSKEVFHWDKISELDPRTKTRFTVHLVPTSDDCQEMERNHTQSQDPMIHYRPPTPIEDSTYEPSYYGATPMSKKPSAPSLDQLEETTNPYARAALQLSRTVTAPGRLQVEDGRPTQEGGDDEPKLEQKTVSFFFADENSNPNKGTDSPKSAVIYIEDSYDEIHTNKDTSETADSGYGDETSFLFTDYRKRQQQQQSIVPMVTRGGDTGGYRKMMPHSLTQDEPEVVEGPAADLSKEKWQLWLAIIFTLVDIALIIAGSCLLAADFYSNIILGFILLGIGIGMLVPGLNYIGGFPTVCTLLGK